MSQNRSRSSDEEEFPYSSPSSRGSSSHGRTLSQDSPMPPTTFPHRLLGQIQESPRSRRDILEILHAIDGRTGSTPLLTPSSRPLSPASPPLPVPIFSPGIIGRNGTPAEFQDAARGLIDIIQDRHNDHSMSDLRKFGDGAMEALAAEIQKREQERKRRAQLRGSLPWEMPADRYDHVVSPGSNSSDKPAYLIPNSSDIDYGLITPQSGIGGRWSSDPYSHLPAAFHFGQVSTEKTHAYVDELTRILKEANDAYVAPNTKHDANSLPQHAIKEWVERNEFGIMNMRNALPKDYNQNPNNYLNLKVEVDRFQNNYRLTNEHIQNLIQRSLSGR